MRFGKCRKCRKYKYLQKKATCISCLKSDNKKDWVVVHINPFTGSRIYKRNLSEENAKKIAKKSRYLIPSPDREM